MLDMRFFTLSERRDGRGLSCGEDGIFLGDCPLVVPTTDERGRRLYAVRPLSEINRRLSASYGKTVDLAGRMSGLRQAAAYLTEEKWALAQIAAVQLRMPDLRDAAAARLRLRKADALRRFNPHHYPGGSGRGGQFAPSAEDSAGARDAASPTDITHRKFASEEEAARFALRAFYEKSKRAGVEYAGAIYRRADDSYGITLPTTEDEPSNSRIGSIIRWTDIPAGAKAVASYHTHLETEGGPSQDENVNTFDRAIARHTATNMYVGTPAGHLKVYNVRTGTQTDLGTFR